METTSDFVCGVNLQCVEQKTARGCRHFRKAVRLVQAIMGEKETAYFFNHKFDHCYCPQCETDTGKTHSRGGADYHMPRGWVRFALPVNDIWAEAMGVWSDWPNWYHPVLYADNMPHFVETMAILQNGDVGPFAEVRHVARASAASGDGIHFMRSMRFQEAQTQGYGHAYEDLSLAVQARVHPVPDEITSGPAGKAFDKLTTHRRLAHILVGVLVRPPADDKAFETLLGQYLRVGRNFADAKKQCLDHGKEGRDMIFASCVKDWEFKNLLSVSSLQFKAVGQHVTEDERLPFPVGESMRPQERVCEKFKIAQCFVTTRMGLEKFVNQKYMCCWCPHCFSADAPDFASSGHPRRPYEIPKGWCEFPVECPLAPNRARRMRAKWHVAYHATKGGPPVIESIVKRGSSLLKAGDHTFDGRELKVGDGHITSSFKRTNAYCGKQELFNPTDKFFSSPAWQYIDNAVYSMRPSPVFQGRTVDTMLKIFIRPNSYAVGQSTTPGARLHDNPYWKDRLEYYSDRYGSHMVQSVLVRIND